MTVTDGNWKGFGIGLKLAPDPVYNFDPKLGPRSCHSLMDWSVRIAQSGTRVRPQPFFRALGMDRPDLASPVFWPVEEHGLCRAAAGGNGPVRTVPAEYALNLVLEFE